MGHAPNNSNDPLKEPPRASRRSARGEGIHSGVEDCRGRRKRGRGETVQAKMPHTDSDTVDTAVDARREGEECGILPFQLAKTPAAEQSGPSAANLPPQLAEKTPPKTAAGEPPPYAVWTTTQLRAECKKKGIKVWQGKSCLTKEEILKLLGGPTNTSVEEASGSVTGEITEEVTADTCTSAPGQAVVPKDAIEIESEPGMVSAAVKPDLKKLKGKKSCSKATKFNDYGRAWFNKKRGLWIAYRTGEHVQLGTYDSSEKALFAIEEDAKPKPKLERLEGRPKRATNYSDHGRAWYNPKRDKWVAFRHGSQAQLGTHP